MLTPIRPTIRNSVRTATELGRGRTEKITAPPDAVITVSPPDGAVNQQLDIALYWQRPSMAKSYRVYTGATAETLTLKSTQLARTYVPEGLELDSGLYWQVVVVNALGETVSEVFHFTTWSIDDILTDGDDVPVTDGNGDYIETPS